MSETKLLEERSLEEYRERRAEEEREEARQRRTCQCANPVPGYKVMGQTPCAVCRRWIP